MYQITLLLLLLYSPKVSAPVRSSSMLVSLFTSAMMRCALVRSKTGTVHKKPKPQYSTNEPQSMTDHIKEEERITFGNKRRRLLIKEKPKNDPWIEERDEFLFIDLKSKKNFKVHQKLVTQQLKIIKKLKFKLRGSRLKVRMIKKSLEKERNELDDLMRAKKNNVNKV